MRAARIAPAVVLCAITSAAFTDGGHLPSDWYRDLAIEVAHYDCAPIPEGFPETPSRVFWRWLVYTIRPQARPSPDARRLAHPTDGETCDAIAVDSEYHGRPMRLLQTGCRCVVVIDVRDREFDSAEAAAGFVSQVAKALFTEGDRAHMAVVQAPTGGFHGRQVTVWATAEEGRARHTWFDGLHWWLDHGELVMAFTKTYPGSRRVTYAGKAFDLYWFTPRPDAPPAQE